MSLHKIVSLAAPTQANDAATKQYVDNAITNPLVPTPSYSTTLTTLAASTVYTITHSLNLPFD